MKADFSRNTYNPGARFSRVLMQQGRVLLDAEWNEQNEIHVQARRNLAADLIGRHGGPRNDLGFRIDASATNLVIHPGRYYVDGIAVSNDHEVRFDRQDEYPLDPNDLPWKENGTYLVYLDVFERLVTYAENPNLREVALGGADTAARGHVVWQVKAVEVELNQDGFLLEWRSFVEAAPNRGGLAFCAKLDGPDQDPCVTSPEARYRGPENQFYRVEICTSGYAGKDENSNAAHSRWCDNNGSIIYPVIASKAGLHLEHLGKDEGQALVPGSLVELVTATTLKRGEPGQMAYVTSTNRVEGTVTLESEDGAAIPLLDTNLVFLRRWKGIMPVLEGPWRELADGIQIRFAESEATTPHFYRAGDYWQAAARTATGEVDWPEIEEKPVAQGPAGINHHYAPLQLISADGGKLKALPKGDMRCFFMPLCKPISASS